MIGLILIDKLRWEQRSIPERNGVEWSEEIELKSVQEKTVYDVAESTINFSKQRVTDLPFNRRITVPPPRDDTSEIVFANMKTRIINAAQRYIDLNCDSKGNIRNQNVDKSELEGLKSLKKRVNDGEILIVPTDKSDRLPVESFIKFFLFANI